MRDDRKKALTEGVNRPVENVLPFRPRRSPSAAHRDDETTPRRRREVVATFRRSNLVRVARVALPVLALAGVGVGIWYWVFQSPAFALTEIHVDVDGDRVAEGWVRQALTARQGDNLPLLRLDEIDGTLQENPWVKTTGLRKDFPHGLSVRVVEKLPVAILRRPAEDSEHSPGLHYVDVDGAIIAPLGKEFAEVDLPLLTTSVSELGLHGAVDLLREIEETDPIWARGLSEIEVLGEMDFRVWSTHQPFPLLVRAGTLARKSAYLEKLLQDMRRRYDGIESVDLRFARKIILQPSVRRGPRRAADVLQKGLSG